MSNHSNDLFVAWQDGVGRGIYPVARLRVDDQTGRRQFEFRYIRGAMHARSRGFSPFPSFPALNGVYRSHELFPFFKNRVMQPNRPDFAGYVTELGLPQEADPIALLARSGGTRATDRIEVYAAPASEMDTCIWHFLLRGIRHLSAAAESRIAGLVPGERLYVVKDVQNEFNPHALLLRSEDKVNLGYVPDMLLDDLNRLECTADNPVVTVDRVNPPPSPVQHRLLCRLRAHWPAGMSPFNSERYQPLDS